MSYPPIQEPLNKYTDIISSKLKIQPLSVFLPIDKNFTSILCCLWKTCICIPDLPLIFTAGCRNMCAAWWRQLSWGYHLSSFIMSILLTRPMLEPERCIWKARPAVRSFRRSWIRL